MVVGIARDRDKSEGVLNRRASSSERHLPLCRRFASCSSVFTASWSGNNCNVMPTYRSEQQDWSALEFCLLRSKAVMCALKELRLGLSQVGISSLSSGTSMHQPIYQSWIPRNTKAPHNI